MCTQLLEAVAFQQEHQRMLSARLVDRLQAAKNHATALAASQRQTRAANEGAALASFGAAVDHSASAAASSDQNEYD